MAAVDHLAHARNSLDALSRVLEEAAADGRGVDEILDDALAHLVEARAIIDSLFDDEGTE
jgi:hypothetical protein